MSKDSLYYECKIELPLELGSEILCDVTYHIENNGIGSYEFWGQCGFDEGSDYAEFDKIEPLWGDETAEEIREIIKYIDENWDTVCEEINEKL